MTASTANTPASNDFVLVPREPTPKMVAATWDHEIDREGGLESQNTRNKRIYAAMLAAAPASPEPASNEAPGRGGELAELIGRLRNRAEEDRACARNSEVVSDLLQPQLDAFNQRDGSHNTYAVRLQLDHRNSAKRDRQYADDLEAAIRILAAQVQP